MMGGLLNQAVAGGLTFVVEYLPTCGTFHTSLHIKINALK